MYTLSLEVSVNNVKESFKVYIFIVYIHVGGVQRKFDKNFEDLVFEIAKRKRIVPAEWVRYRNLYIKLVIFFINRPGHCCDK